MLNVGFQLNDFDTCLGPEATDLTERIALAFSAVVLCALCEPRYDPPRIPNKSSKVPAQGRCSSIMDCIRRDCEGGYRGGGAGGGGCGGGGCGGGC